MRLGLTPNTRRAQENTKFAAQFGFIPTLDQQITPEQMSKPSDKMLFNGTADLTVMLRMKNETANSAMKEKRTGLGPLGELVQESVNQRRRVATGKF